MNRDVSAQTNCLPCSNCLEVTFDPNNELTGEWILKEGQEEGGSCDDGGCRFSNAQGAEHCFCEIHDGGQINHDVCEATKSTPTTATTTTTTTTNPMPGCSRIKISTENGMNDDMYDYNPNIDEDMGYWDLTDQTHLECGTYKKTDQDLYLFKLDSANWVTSSVVGQHSDTDFTLKLPSSDCYLSEESGDGNWNYYDIGYSWYSNANIIITC